MNSSYLFRAHKERFYLNHKTKSVFFSQAIDHSLCLFLCLCFGFVLMTLPVDSSNLIAKNSSFLIFSSSWALLILTVALSYRLICYRLFNRTLGQQILNFKRSFKSPKFFIGIAVLEASQLLFPPLWFLELFYRNFDLQNFNDYVFDYERQQTRTERSAALS